MIGYATLGTRDLPRAVAFYDALLGEMGAKRFLEMETFVAWHKDFGSPGLSVTLPFNKEPATVGNGNMVALQADSPEQVDRLYAKALELGGTDEGPAGPRGEKFYAGYFRDLDGNKLSFFCMV